MKPTQTLASSISTRLLRAGTAIWLISALLVALGMAAMFWTDQAYSRDLDQSEALHRSAIEFNTAIVTEMLNTRAFLISGEAESLAQREFSHADVERQLVLLQAQQARMSAADAARIEILASLHAEYDRVAAEMIKLRKNGQDEQAARLFDARSDPLVAKVIQTSTDLENAAWDSLIQNDRGYSAATTRTAVLLGLAFLFASVMLAFYLFRVIARPLSALESFETGFVSTHKSGQYPALPVPAGAPPEAGPLYEAYNHMVVRLNESSAATLGYMDRLAHEMKSLLASIMGYAGLVGEPGFGFSSKEIEEFGRLIAAQARRMFKMVEDGLLGARITAGKFNPLQVPTSLRQLLQAQVAESAAAAGRSITLEEDGAAPLVFIDPVTFRGALENLLDNAVKYSPADSPVTVRVAHDSAAGRVYVEVRDCGPGITAEDQGRLFQPFIKIRNQTNGHIPGHGMGLYIARAVLQAQGGTVSLRSQPGQGTTAVLELPVEAV